MSRVAAAGAVLGRGIGLAQEMPIQIAGRPVEITLSSVSPETVRITIQAIENGQPQPIASDGALVQENWGQPAARLRTLAGARSVRCGDLTVKFSANPLTIRVEAQGSHGYRPLDRQILEQADMWAFAARHTGMDVKPMTVTP